MQKDPINESIIECKNFHMETHYICNCENQECEKPPTHIQIVKNLTNGLWFVNFYSDHCEDDPHGIENKKDYSVIQTYPINLK